MGSIRSNEVIEDLLTETIASPLLEATKKEEIVRALSDLHSLGKLYGAVKDSTILFHDFLSYLKTSKTPAESEQLVKAMKSEELQKTKSSAQTPELFAMVAGFVAVLASLAQVADISGAVQLLPKFFNSDILTSIGLGVAGSVLAAVITVFIQNNRK
jgi:hypothetical protein